MDSDQKKAVEDWNLNKERVFMENLLQQRFNFFVGPVAGYFKIADIKVMIWHQFIDLIVVCFITNPKASASDGFHFIFIEIYHYVIFGLTQSGLRILVN